MRVIAAESVAKFLLENCFTVGESELSVEFGLCSLLKAQFVFLLRPQSFARA